MVQQDIAVNKKNIQHINAQSLFNKKQDQTALLACLDFAFHKKENIKKKKTCCACLRVSLSKL